MISFTPLANDQIMTINTASFFFKLSGTAAPLFRPHIFAQDNIWAWAIIEGGGSFRRWAMKPNYMNLGAACEAAQEPISGDDFEIYCIAHNNNIFSVSYLHCPR